MNDLGFVKKAYKYHQEEKCYYDYLISGKPLSELIPSIYNDLVGMLGYWGEEQDQHLVALLTGKAKSALPKGRILLYGCAACGDIGCGAITVNLEFKGNKVYWREMGSEGLGDYSIEGFEHCQDIEFEANRYFKALASGLARLD